MTPFADSSYQLIISSYFVPLINSPKLLTKLGSPSNPPKAQFSELSITLSNNLLARLSITGSSIFTTPVFHTASAVFNTFVNILGPTSVTGPIAFTDFNGIVIVATIIKTAMKL